MPNSAFFRPERCLFGNAYDFAGAHMDAPIARTCAWDSLDKPMLR